jgi:predicted PurR-regulated permease PerM
VAELEEETIRRWPLVLAVVVALGVSFFLLKPILSPFVLGILFGYLGDPMVDYLEKHRIKRTAGVVLVFLVFSAFVAIAVLLAAPLLVRQLDLLVQKIPLVYQWLIDVVGPWLQQRFNLPMDQLPKVDWSDQLADNWASLGKVTASTLKKLTGSGANILLWLTNLALVPVVAFYLMRDWDRLKLKVLNLFPLAWQGEIAALVSEADEVVGAFLRGQFLVMCSLAVIYCTGLWMIGVQLALVLGLIAGMASIVPYLGFIVGIVISGIVAWAQYQELGILLWVALVFGVGQAIESMVLTPLLVGDRIGLHPVAVIFVLMAGGQIAGFIGVVVALPVAAVIMVFVRHAVAHYRSSDIYHHGSADAGSAAAVLDEAVDDERPTGERADRS